jgi:hypothetical protein
MISFTNLKNYENTTAGVAETVLIAPVAWFAANGIKGPGLWALPGDDVKIKESHVFLPDKGFIEVFLAPEKNQLSAKSSGDTGFKKLDKELSLYFPGSYAQLHEWVGSMLNTPVIALIQDSNCVANMWYQIGNACNYAYLSADFSTDTTKGTAKGYNLTLTHTAKKIMLYEGVITRLSDEEGGGSGDVQGGLLTEDFNFLLTTEDGEVLTQE